MFCLQVLNSRVTRVDAGEVTIIDKDGSETALPFGACVWATGVAMNPLIKSLQARMPEQNHFRALLTDDKLRVLGSGDAMWAIGDASTIAAPKALDYANELFELADTDGNGVLSLSELRVCHPPLPFLQLATVLCATPCVLLETCRRRRLEVGL